MDLNPSMFHAGHSVDCVILAYENQELKILLLKWKLGEAWSLPGGYIFKEEDLSEAANRVLFERTGLNDLYLKQFYTFGRKDRSNVANFKSEEQLFKQLKLQNADFFKWASARFISTAYFSFADIHKAKPMPDAMSSSCEWVSLKDVPDLLMDHQQIVNKAMEYIKIQLNYLPISILLLPIEFTMRDLQNLYESVLQKKLERSNFQRKMLALGIFIQGSKKMTGASNKAPYLYSFNKEKYKELVQKGVGIL